MQCEFTCEVCGDKEEGRWDYYRAFFIPCGWQAERIKPLPGSRQIVVVVCSPECWRKWERKHAEAGDEIPA
jgi:hypothetical protein